MKFIMLCIFITSVHVRNSRNVEFNELPEEKLLDAICRSFRKHVAPNNLSCDVAACQKGHGNFSLAEFQAVKDDSDSFLPKLICKESNAAHFFWKSKEDFVYFLQVINIDEEKETFTNLTTCNSYTLKDLMDSATYKVQLWAVSFSRKQFVRSNVTTIEKLNSRSTLAPVTDVFLQNITCEENSCDAVIGWAPNKDFSCEYDLVWPKENDINEDRINVISGRHQATLRYLNFDTNYTVNISARDGNTESESEKKSFSFNTPTCLKVHHSLEKCRPEPPQHLVINETIADSFEGILTFNVHLSWEKPDLQPHYYIAHFSNLLHQTEPEKFIKNITGNETKAVFEKVKLDNFYHISLMACSPGGCSDKVVDERHRTNLITIDVSTHQQWRMLLLILAPLIIVLAGTVLINYYRAKHKRKEERDRYFTGLDEEKLPESAETLEINLIKQDIPDQWELDQDKLCFQSVIGEGAFGVVRRAYLEMKNSVKIQVAVKMLKESPSSEEIRQFTQEINIMKSVRQHPYIVSLIGCVTEGRVEGPLLVVEYCSRGDLQTYLRNAWDKFCSIQQEVVNSDESFNNQKNFFTNRIYDLHDINLGDEFIIQPKHLLSIARQVALGMEHLARTRVVHRDLAARNVLVCENHTVKVSDFGLSRDVYRDNVYCKNTGGKLPIRWMALESLTHQRYTTYSDVWSFGVLLWEIVTLGGTPYVGVHSSDLLEFLKSGSRLARPSNCSPELYTIMLNCWKASPKNRPTFTEICKCLEELLENVSHYLLLENVDVSSLNFDSKKHIVSKLSQSFCSSERYIKPDM